MPTKKKYPRNFIVGVNVTALEKEAIRREKQIRGTTESDVTYRLMQKGGLSELVASSFGPDWEQITNDGVDCYTDGS